jgi:hypothetical protein
VTRLGTLLQSFCLREIERGERRERGQKGRENRKSGKIDHVERYYELQMHQCEVRWDSS